MRLLELKEILIAIDLEDDSLAAVGAARQLAEAAGASLHAIHVILTPGSDAANAIDPPPALLDALQRAGARIDRRNVHAFRGNPARGIAAVAERIGANVIVLGPHRPGPRSEARPGLRGTALTVVTNSSAPCLIVSRPLELPLERVLVPIDLSNTARGALLVGLSWASALRSGAHHGTGDVGATLTALHVTGQPDGASNSPLEAGVLENELEYARREAGTWAGVSIEGATTTSGDIAQGIVEYAATHGPGLVVLGTRGIGLDAIGRLGSIAATVLPRLSAPVLLVPPAVWHSHVATVP